MSKPPSHHQVMFLCNNNHGLLAGHVECIEVHDEFRITCQKPTPTRFWVGNKRIKVGRRFYPYLSWQTCVGNLFWDAFTMHVAEVRSLLRNLLADGWAAEEYAEEGRSRISCGALNGAPPWLAWRGMCERSRIPPRAARREGRAAGAGGDTSRE